MDTTLRKVLLRCVDDAEISRDRRNQARPDDAISMQRLPSSRLQNLRHVGRDSLSELARLGVEGFELLVQRFEEADGFSSLDRCAAAIVGLCGRFPNCPRLNATYAFNRGYQKCPNSSHPFQGWEFIMIPNPGWRLRRNPWLDY